MDSIEIFRQSLEEIVYRLENLEEKVEGLLEQSDHDTNLYLDILNRLEELERKL